MLPDTPLLLAFAGAGLVLALTPGPAVVYIVARTLAQGRACGLASVVGVALGNLANAVGAAIGLVALLNPKTTLFFAASLPQFMDAHASPLLQTLALGGVFVGVACCTDLIYVLTASLVAPRLSRAARHAVWGNRLAGTSFIGLGVLTAIGTRPAR